MSHSDADQNSQIKATGVTEIRPVHQSNICLEESPPYALTSNSLQGLSSLAGAQTPAPSGTTPFQESSLLHIQKLPLLDFHFSGSSGHTAEHSSSFSLMRPVVQPDPFFPKRGEGAYLLQPPELRSKPPGAAPCNWHSLRCRQNNFHLTRSNRLCQAL